VVHITEGEWLTATEAAAYFKVSRERLAQFLRAGRIPYTQVGRQFIIRKDIADQFRHETRKPGRPKLAPKVADTRA